MLIDITLLCLGLFGLVVGSYTDFKTREVPDWVNYGLILSGLGLRAIGAVINRDVMFLVYGLIGLALFVALAYALFYLGQWGGGDSKMLMAIGVLFATYPEFLLKYFNPRFLMPFSVYRVAELPFLAVFLINLLVCSAFYGMFFSIYLAFRNREAFFKELKQNLKQYRKARLLFLLFVIILFTFVIFFGELREKYLFFFLSVLLIFTFYLWIFVKAVEKACMYKLVSPDKLTEGDWIAKDVKVDKKYICGPKDLGISKKQIKKLIQLHGKGKVKNILIKVGIPFVPSFLIAMVLSLVYGSLLFWLG